MYKVVIVDDEINIRDSIVKLDVYEELGFKIIGCASNGIEALELVETTDIDLIITDIKMPYMDGLELARTVRELYPDIAIAFLSGYDDFKFAKEAIKYNIVSYMLKPIDKKNFTAELKEIKNKLDSKRMNIFKSKQEDNNEEIKKQRLINILLPMLTDKYASLSTIIQDPFLELNSIHKENFKYLVLMTSFDIKNLKENNVVNESKQLVVFVDNIVNKYSNAISFYYDSRVVSLIYDTERNINKYSKIISKEIYDVAKKYLNTEVYIGLSGTNELKCINDAYADSFYAVLYAKNSETPISAIFDIEKGREKNYEYISYVIEQLERLLKIGSIKEFRKGIEVLINKCISRNIDLELFYIQLKVITFKVIDTINITQATKNIKTKISNMEFKGNLISPYRDKIMDLLIEVKNIILTEREDITHSLCDSAIMIIDEKFSDYELSLAIIAKELSCSVPYLSSIIKKFTGKTFSTILTSRRMKKAKDLLEGTSLKVSNIASECGYEDQHYFSYSVKRYYNLTPLQIRKNAQEN